MSEVEEALSLAGAIYDAALDPESWPEVLRQLTAFIGGTASALHSHDVPARSVRFHYSWGDDPHYTRLYAEKYVGLNPAVVPLLMLKVGDVGTLSEMIPRRELHASRYHKEWAVASGIVDATTAMLRKTGTVVTHVTTAHADGYGAEARRRLATMVPHFQRAVAIGGLLDTRVEAATLVEAVDALAAGVFLVREDGTLVHANSSGRAMLNAGGMVCVDRTGTLHACGASARRTLRETIGDAVAGRLELGPRGVAVPLIASDGERYVAHVLPLTSGARRAAGRPCEAAAAVFVHHADLGGDLPLEALAREFGLSAAELRVLVAVVDLGGGIPEIAPVLGIAEPTVKTHLRRLFEKTGTHRQADLVKLVAGYSNPLLGRPELVP
jgi:DNA-binding CsgD family transcriptional regulator